MIQSAPAWCAPPISSPLPETLRDLRAAYTAHVDALHIAHADVDRIAARTRAIRARIGAIEAKASGE